MNPSAAATTTTIRTTDPRSTQNPTDPRTASSQHATRTRRHDLAALPAVLHGEYIKLTTLRSTTAIAVLTGLIGVFATWATAALVKDEVLVVSDVFVYSTFLTAVIAAITAILSITSEVQHGTWTAALTAQPARWVLVAGKTIMAVRIGVVLGAIGMVTGTAGAVLGGLDAGDTGSMISTASWALTFTVIASVLGLGVGLIVRHSAAAISGLIVWWLVVENLLWAFLPETVSRFLPFYAGGALLGVDVDTTTPETIAVALSRTQDALVFGGYAAVALLVGTVLLYRRDASQ
jgi:ABC-2 type transport system permease protein